MVFTSAVSDAPENAALKCEIWLIFDGTNKETELKLNFRPQIFRQNRQSIKSLKRADSLHW